MNVSQRISFMGLTLMPVLLSGCLYGQCMEGMCAFERAEYLKSIKSYGTHWVKEGWSIGQRREDSWSCGAARTELAADHVVFSPEQLRQERRREDKDDFAPRTRLTKAWVACMQSKGYRYEK